MTELTLFELYKIKHWDTYGKDIDPSWERHRQYFWFSSQIWLAVISVISVLIYMFWWRHWSMMIVWLMSFKTLTEHSGMREGFFDGYQAGYHDALEKAFPILVSDIYDSRAYLYDAYEEEKNSRQSG